MLRWRLLLGTLLVAGLVGLSWLDHQAAIAGVWLFPVAVVLTVLGTREVLHLAQCGGMRPLSWPVYLGNLAIVATSWLAPLAGSALKQEADSWTAGSGQVALSTPVWALLVFGLAVLLVFFGEIVRYEKPGGITANLAAGILCLAYIGMLMGLVVQLRMAYGVGALASLILIVKLNDTGAYTVGRTLGRHKLAPRLSPGKTIEGALGGLVFACIGSWAVFRYLAADGTYDLPAWAIWLPFAVLVGTAGIVGDLAESLIKRDVGQKDSSNWLPGFGGVLDIVDSILLATPVAYICWVVGALGG